MSEGPGATGGRLCPGCRRRRGARARRHARGGRRPHARAGPAAAPTWCASMALSTGVLEGVARRGGVCVQAAGVPARAVQARRNGIQGRLPPRVARMRAGCSRGRPAAAAARAPWGVIMIVLKPWSTRVPTQFDSLSLNLRGGGWVYSAMPYAIASPPRRGWGWRAAEGRGVPGRRHAELAGRLRGLRALHACRGRGTNAGTAVRAPPPRALTG